MGLEYFLFFILCLGDATALAVVVRMLMTKRFLAAGVALTMALLAHLPFFVMPAKEIILPLVAECIAAIVVGAISLIASRRHVLLVGVVLSIALSVAIFIATKDVTLEGAARYLIIVPAFLVLSFMAAPGFVALASVFFIGAFVEQRPYRGCPRLGGA